MEPHVVPQGHSSSPANSGSPKPISLDSESSNLSVSGLVNYTADSLPLSFGTAGIREVVGDGAAKLNLNSISPYFTGHAKFLRSQNLTEQPLVVIGFDARRSEVPNLASPLSSEDIAKRAAEIYSANGLHVMLFTELTPTPILAYAVKALRATAGVMITASHNPPEYNGAKFYDSTGAQISSATAARISEFVATVLNEGNATTTYLSENGSISGTIDKVPSAVAADYLKATRTVRQDKRALVDNLPFAASLSERPRIVYTPMQGVGGNYALSILKDEGYTHEDIHPVFSQFSPDGSFGAVSTPNPEDPRAFDRAINIAKSISADIIFATDPDADRLAVAVPDGRGEFIVLTGNQLGAIIGHYILSGSAESGRLDSSRDFMVTTFVSSELLPAVARLFDVNCLQTYVGFKWICDAVFQRERIGERFLFGYEQAIGYMIGDLVYDKDGLSALRLMAELAAKRKFQGSSVLEYLYEIYQQAGLHVSCEKGIKLPVVEDRNRLMEKLRHDPPPSIAGQVLTDFVDFQDEVQRRLTDNPRNPLGLPSYDLVVLKYGPGLTIQARPSGTEPKVKFYAHSACSMPHGSPGQIYDGEHKKLNSILSDFVEELCK